MTNSNNHYVKRFQDTQLDAAAFLELKNFAQSLGFVTICTPFDEPSVRKIIEHNFDFLKIASACTWSSSEIVRLAFPLGNFAFDRASPAEPGPRTDHKIQHQGVTSLY